MNENLSHLFFSDDIRRSICCFLLPLFFLGSLFSAAAQTAPSCGALTYHKAETRDSDYLVFDRFGNTYDVREPAPRDARTTNIDYFELTFVGIPANQQVTICQVFADVAEAIPQRTQMTSCGEPTTPGPVRIEISAITSGPLGAASPNYRNAIIDNPCSALQTNRVYEKINGTEDPLISFPNSGGFDGIMEINQNPPEPWHLDWTTTPPALSYDLYSVVLHEMTHILGFASLGTPGNAYSLWDKELFTIPMYDPTGPSPVPVPILEGDCQRNCWTLNSNTFSNYNDFENAVVNNCTTVGNLDFVFGSDILAPIAGGNGVPPQNLNDVLNYLSHLSPSCNGVNQQYLMQPSLLPGEFIRDWTGAEVSILCRLGYDVNGCDGCYTIASDIDNPQRTYEQRHFCCAKEYYACENETIIIPESDLLCNDFTNGAALTITDVFSTSANVTVNLVGSNIEIVSTNQGTYEIGYTVSGCDCRLSNASFFVDIGPCVDCTLVDPCQNLTCVNGFEDFQPGVNIWTLHQILGAGYWVYNNSGSNSVDICQETTGNQYMLLTGHSGNLEGVALTLSEPIEPGCTATIDLTASAYIGASALNIYGSEDYPCHPSSAFINPGCTPTDCGGSSYEPICIDNIPINNTVPAVIFGGCVDAPALAAIPTITWENLTSTTINYLILSPEILNRTIFVDDVVVTRSCLKDPEFSYTIDCGFVAFTSDNQEPGTMHLWEFGDTETSNETNPIHEYATGGSYNVVHTIFNDCETLVHSETITVPDFEADATFTYMISDCTTSVTFSANATNGSHEWDFDGDLSTVESTAINPSYTFPQFGTYTVTHTVTNNCGTSTETQTITLTDCNGACTCPTLLDGGDALLISASGLPAGSYDNTNSCLAINGTLVIDVDYTITGGELQMLPGAEIVVNPFVEFTLDGVNENGGIHGCDEMWRGIRVRSFAELNMNDCIIQDAFRAVSAEDQSKLNIDVTTFDKNYIGVHTPGAGGGALQFVNARLVDNTFSCSGDLLPEYDGLVLNSTRSFAGVNLNFTQTFVIGGYWGDPQTNTFTGLKHGIYLETCNSIQIQNIVVNDLIDQAIGILMRVSVHIVVDNSNMTGVLRGIYGWGAEPIIKNNNIDSDNEGITLFSGIGRKAFIADNIVSSPNGCIKVQSYTGDKVEIFDNTLSKGALVTDAAIIFNNIGARLVIKDNPITFAQGGGIWGYNSNAEITVEKHAGIVFTGSPTPGFANVGMSFASVSGAQVYDNHVSSTGSNYSSGLTVFDSPNNLYCCNSMTSSVKGAEFYGSCGGTRLKGTSFGSHNTGLMLVNAVIGVQEFHGNDWAGATTSLDARFYGGSGFANVFASQFLTNPGYVPSGHTKIQVNGGGTPQQWFQFLGNDPSCSYYCGETPLPPALPPFPPQEVCEDLHTVEITDHDRVVAAGVAGTLPIDEGIEWTEQHRLYEKLYCNPELLGKETLIDQFYTEAKNGAIGNYHPLRVGVEDLILPLQSPELDALLTLADEERAAIMRLNEMLGFDPLPGNEAELAERDSLLGEFAQNSLSILILESDHADDKITLSQQLLALNSETTASAVFESNEKTINDIYLRTIAAGIESFTPAQKTLINSVAIQCALSGGEAVHRARALQAMYNEAISYDDYTLCGTRGSSLLSNDLELSSDHQGMQLFPNPTSGRFDLVMKEALPDVTKLLLYDLAGKERKAIELPAGSIKTEVDVHQLPAGIYLCVVKGLDGTIYFQEKLVLMKTKP